MSQTFMRASQRVYAAIIKLYPKSYQQEFGEEMEFVFSELLNEAYTQNGNPGIMRLWTRTIMDVAKSLAAQHLQNPERNKKMKPTKNDIFMKNQVFIWIVAITGALLLIPLLAMQFTSDVNWTPGDFLTMGTLLSGAGTFFVLAARKLRKTSQRVAAGIVMGLAFLYIWAELAVGIFTHWGN